MASDSAKIIHLLAVLMKKIQEGEIGVKDLEKFLGEQKKFKDPKTFEIVMSEDWESDRALAEMEQEFEKEKYHFNPNITKDHFKTSALKPGRQVKIHICEIKKPVSSDNCLEFVKSQGGFCLGASDAAAIWRFAKDELPGQKWLIFLNELDNLWHDSDGWVRVPILYRHGDGDWSVRLSHFARDWNPGDCLVFASAA